MTVTIDLNVILDVFLQRGEYIASIEILNLCKKKEIRGCIPSHGIPTIYYILSSKIERGTPIKVVDDLLDTLEITPIGKEQLLHARTLNVPDFEDAIVAASAIASSSEYIITGNVKDFTNVNVDVMTAEEFRSHFLSK